jgi:alanine racemase
MRGVLDLRPVLSMRTRVAHLKRVPAGEKLGYGHTYATGRASTIATLPIGYHDGFIRQFSNVADVLVGGRRAPVVGRVCMDQTLVDVTEVPGVGLGDEVVIYGRQGEQQISVEEMARRVDRIPYELTCCIGRRVRREFVLNGAVVVESPFTSVVGVAALGGIFQARAAGQAAGQLSHDQVGAKPAQRGAA